MPVEQRRPEDRDASTAPGSPRSGTPWRSCTGPGAAAISWVNRNPVRPSASRLSTTPSTTWSTRYRMASTASSAAMNSPPSAAAIRPAQLEPKMRAEQGTGERAGQQLPLDRHVDHAGALAQHAGERAEDERHARPAPATGACRPAAGRCSADRACQHRNDSTRHDQRRGWSASAPAGGRRPRPAAPPRTRRRAGRSRSRRPSPGCRCWLPRDGLGEGEPGVDTGLGQRAEQHRGARCRAPTKVAPALRAPGPVRSARAPPRRCAVRRSGSPCLPALRQVAGVPPVPGRAQPENLLHQGAAPR